MPHRWEKQQKIGLWNNLQLVNSFNMAERWGGSKTQLLLDISYQSSVNIFPCSYLCADDSVTCLYETNFKKSRGWISFFVIMFKVREALRFKQLFFGMPVV